MLKEAALGERQEAGAERRGGAGKGRGRAGRGHAAEVGSWLGRGRGRRLTRRPRGSVSSPLLLLHRGPGDQVRTRAWGTEGPGWLDPWAGLDKWRSAGEVVG